MHSFSGMLRSRDQFFGLGLGLTVIGLGLGLGSWSRSQSHEVLVSGLVCFGLVVLKRSFAFLTN